MLTDQQQRAVDRREATAAHVEGVVIDWLRKHAPAVTLGDADAFAKIVGDNVRQGMREALETGQCWRRDAAA